MATLRSKHSWSPNFRSEATDQQAWCVGQSRLLDASTAKPVCSSAPPCTSIAPFVGFNLSFPCKSFSMSSEWQELQSLDGQTYYYNPSSGETTYTPPPNFTTLLLCGRPVPQCSSHVSTQMGEAGLTQDAGGEGAHHCTPSPPSRHAHTQHTQNAACTRIVSVGSYQESQLG
jgi:hypothetical protein